MSTPSIESTRRRFLGLALGTGAAAGLLVSGSASAVPAEPEPKKKEEEEVAPGEDLMREHGVLKRVLLVYGEAIRRIDARADLPPEPIADAARIIHDFIEEYHEKLEEDQLFPRFRKANRLVELVDVLDQQHKAGRKVTAYGAAAKGNTFLNYCGTTAADVVASFDANPAKQGKFLPGSHVPIFAPAAVAEIRPDDLVIMPWNLKDEIMGQTAFIRDWGGRFVIASPEVQVLP